MTLVDTRCIFLALSASKMHLQLGLCPEPCCRSLQYSPRPCSLLLPYQEPLPQSQPSASNFTVPPRQISGYAHRFREQSKLLQSVPFQRKGRTTTVLHAYLLNKCQNFAVKSYDKCISNLGTLSQLIM